MSSQVLSCVLLSGPGLRREIRSVQSQGSFGHLRRRRQRHVRSECVEGEIAR